MKIRNGTFLAALVASLLIHLLAIPISVRVYFGALNPTGESTSVGEHFEEMVVHIEDPHEAVVPPADDPGIVGPDAVVPELKPLKPADDPIDQPLEPPLPKPEAKKPSPDLKEFTIGEANGTGYASHQTPGEQEATARKANEDQAFLSRDPVGTGRVGDEPSQNAVQGSNGRGGTPGEAVVQAAPKPLQAPSGQKGSLGALLNMPTPEQIKSRVTQWAAKLSASDAASVMASQSPVKSASTSLAAPKPIAPSAGKAVGSKEALPRTDDRGAMTVVGPSVGARRIPKTAAAPSIDAKALPAQAETLLGQDLLVGEKEAATLSVAKNIVPTVGIEKIGEEVKPQPDEQQPVAAARPGTGDGRAPGSRAPAADPAPMSESESDPFSKLGSVVVRSGKMDVRFGRKLHSVRPRLTLAGQIDLMSIEDPSIILDVSIDSTGRVSGVEIAKSSGSNEVDQPCRRAMYEWWFEPKKDKWGKPVPDRFQFTINWIK